VQIRQDDLSHLVVDLAERVHDEVEQIVKELAEHVVDHGPGPEEDPVRDTVAASSLLDRRDEVALVDLVVRQESAGGVIAQVFVQILIPLANDAGHLIVARLLLLFFGGGFVFALTIQCLEDLILHLAHGHRPLVEAPDRAESKVAWNCVYEELEHVLSERTPGVRPENEPEHGGADGEPDTVGNLVVVPEARRRLRGTDPARAKSRLR
jgi:hypothetical protein